MSCPWGGDKKAWCADSFQVHSSSWQLGEEGLVPKVWSYQDKRLAPPSGPLMFVELDGRIVTKTCFIGGSNKISTDKVEKTDSALGTTQRDFTA